MLGPAHLYINDPNFPDLPADGYNFHAHIINPTAVQNAGEIDKITLPDVAITGLYNMQRSLVDYFLMPECTSFTFTCEVTNHSGQHLRIRLQRKKSVIKISTVNPRGTKEWGDNCETIVTYHYDFDPRKWSLLSFYLLGEKTKPADRWKLASSFAKDIYESNMWAADTRITTVTTEYEFGRVAATLLQNPVSREVMKE